jgi:uncharacterized protein (DUF1330 family)
MKTNYKVAIALVAGAAIGGAAIQGLHAQAKPPVYLIEEAEYINGDGYVKEFSPLIVAANKAAGVHVLAAAPKEKITAIEGNPPKSRLVLQVWDSIEKIHAYHNSAEYKEARKVGNQYAKIRMYAVEGLSK